MNIDLSGKNALVCGGSKGIGNAAAHQLAEMGANIILVARNAESLAAACKLLPNNVEQKHSFLVADFSDPSDLKKRVNSLVKDRNIHILINNTGGPAGGNIKDAEPDQFLSAFSMHLICNQILATLVLPGMIEDNYGRIINVISTSVKQPLNGLGVSNTIRGAVANWAKTLANEVGVHGITVNNVLPGATSTERLSEIINNKSEKQQKSIDAVSTSMANEVPMKRFARPEEVGSAIAFLASPAASYITGINLPVDGGRTKSL